MLGKFRNIFPSVHIDRIMVHSIDSGIHIGSIIVQYHQGLVHGTDAQDVQRTEYQFTTGAQYCALDTWS